MKQDRPRQIETLRPQHVGRSLLLEVLEDRLLVVEGTVNVLGVVGAAEAVPPAKRTSKPRQLTRYRPQKGRLALAVVPEDGDVITPFDLEVNVLRNDPVGIAHLQRLAT